MFVSKKRIVNEKDFIVSGKKVSNFDETNAFETFLRGEIDYITKCGNPEIMNLDFKFNGESYLKLKLPIIPFVYKEDDEKYLEVMVEKGDPQVVRDIYDESVKKAKDTKDDKFIDDQINPQAARLVNYIRHEIAGAYVKAVEKNDKELMDHIASLNIMEDINLSPEIISKTIRTVSKFMCVYKLPGDNCVKEFTIFLQPKNIPENYKGKDLTKGDDKEYTYYKDELLPLQLKALENYANAKSFDSPNYYGEDFPFMG